MTANTRDQHTAINQTLWAFYYATKDWLTIRDTLNIEESNTLFNLILQDKSPFEMGREIRNAITEIKKKREKTE